MITEQLKDVITEFSNQYQIKIKINVNKFAPREYTRCHQMFQFPVFCADGEIYTCCENKGNPRFSIGRWDQDDFRDLWLGTRHWEVYENINTQFCQPCRPNVNNNEIQRILNNPELLERLNT